MLRWLGLWALRTAWIAFVAFTVVFVWDSGRSMSPMDQSSEVSICALWVEQETGKYIRDYRQAYLESLFMDKKIFLEEALFDDGTQETVFCHWRGNKLLALIIGHLWVKDYTDTAPQ